MDLSCRIGFRCWSQGWVEATSELAFDRLCAVGEPGWPVMARPQEGFRGGGWRRSLSSGLSEPWLRAIVIFALIHRPILPLSFVALDAQ